MSITRRQFIKIGGATAGGLALGSALMTNLWGLTANAVADPNTDGDQVIPTFCEICFWKCGVLAHVKDGRVTKIVGNPAHPLSRGKLCPRGTGGTGLLYDPDRLKRPLVRRERRGEQVFDEVDWDTALDLVADKLGQLKTKYGPESLAMFSHGYGASWFKHLIKAYGTGNDTAPSYAQCRGSREVAFELTFGSSVGSPEYLDLENARVITLLGSHLGENMHNTQVQEFAEAIERGADVIVVDPRFSTAAGKARHWLPIKPGTDIALLLAWMHVIINEGLYDREYLERNAVGFEALARHVADKTPEWAFIHTSIAPEQIVETARLMAGARPASIVHPGRRASWYGDDTQRGRAIALLNALLGSWGRRGGFYVPAAMDVPKLPHPPFDHTPGTPADMPDGVVYPFANKVLAHGIRDASLGDDPAVRGWLVYGTNLLQSLPQPERTMQALQRLDFMVAIDVLPAEITGWADVVLPECTYLERYDDLNAPPYKTPFVSLRQPVVEPMYDSKPGWWIARELGKRLGLAEQFAWESAETFVGARLEAMGSSLEAIRDTGVLLGEAQPITFEEGVAPAFATPSGKIELYSAQLAEAGLPPLPDYEVPEPTPPGHFRLLFGRAPTHTFGRTTNNRMLSEVFDENTLWLNVRTATELGLSDGDDVRLVNQDGVEAGPIKLKATQRIRPDCVYMVHGFGHTSKGLTFARGRGVDDTKLLTRTKVDPVMGGTGLNVNFVRVERWEA